MNKLIIILISVWCVTACEPNKSSWSVGDVPMVVGMFENYYGKNVRVVGYMHQRGSKAVPELIPSKDHAGLGPTASILSLMLFADKDIRNGSVDSEMRECLGKITSVAGRVELFSGVPAIVDIAEVSC